MVICLTHLLFMVYWRTGLFGYANIIARLLIRVRFWRKMIQDLVRNVLLHSDCIKTYFYYLWWSNAGVELHCWGHRRLSIPRQGAILCFKQVLVCGLYFLRLVCFFPGFNISLNLFWWDLKWSESKEPLKEPLKAHLCFRRKFYLKLPMTWGRIFKGCGGFGN